MTPLVVENEPPVTFLRRKMTGGRFSMGVVIRRYTGRFIGENTRLLYDVISQTEIQNKAGMVLLLDFEKAFNSVSWKFIFKVLRFFNFGEFFIRLVSIILNNVKLCVIQHGIFSEFFHVARGCRQGDPASPISSVFTRLFTSNTPWYFLDFASLCRNYGVNEKG